MDKLKIKIFLSCIFYGILWFIIAFILALILGNKTAQNFKNIIFVEGAMLIFASILTLTIRSNWSLYSPYLEENNYEYLSNAALETKNLENKTALKNKLAPSVSMLALLVSGLLCVLLSYNI